MKETIRQLIFEQGFDACGFCDTASLNAEKQYFKTWIDKQFHGTMQYMENHFEKRISPYLLVPNSKTVIVVAQNYFPQKNLSNKNIPIAKYSYGKDYHAVIKNKLHQIVVSVPALKNDDNLRIFVDSAPLLERALAVKAGLGFIGKNNCLIIPQKGSYFLLGEIVTSVKIEPDKPFEKSFCGNCSRCMDSCPTKALCSAKMLDARKCNSYLTIEYQGERFIEKPSGHLFFGCDVCQDVCPHNRFAKPHNEPEFIPKQELIDMKSSDWEKINQEQFDKLFKKTAIERTGLETLQRNIHSGLLGIKSF